MKDENNEQQIDHHLDTLGLMCPEPVMMLHEIMNHVAIGEVVEVLATDPSTKRDIPKFCTFLKHALLSSEERDGQYIYCIRKGGEG